MTREMLWRALERLPEDQPPQAKMPAAALSAKAIAAESTTWCAAKLPQYRRLRGDAKCGPRMVQGDVINVAEIPLASERIDHASV